MRAQGDELRFTPSLKIFSIFLASVVFVGATQQRATSNPGEDPVATEVPDSSIFLRQQMRPAGPAEQTYSSRVDALLAKMTLREKIGQMTQLQIGMIADGKGQSITINPAKLEKAVAQYGVGSILNVDDEALPVNRWHEIINQIQAAAAKTRLHIPVLYGIDSIHGANHIREATLFPQPVAMAATWNPALALRASQITAAETRAASIPWNFSPVLDIGRQPLWPRLYETYGEDPVLAKTMGVAVVRGYEGTDVSGSTSVAVSLKHYVGYSGPLSGRDRTPALIPEITLRQYYFPTFRAAVDAGAHTVMVNSSDVNGVPGHANKYLLTDVLRGEMHFKGLVVSDWEDIKSVAARHQAAANEKEATRIAVMAGIDMSMVPSDYSFSDLLYQLVQEHKVPMSRIDEAVRRVLSMKFALGLFEHPAPDPHSQAAVGTAASRQISLQAARESITLLKNESGMLPLRKNTRVLITGPAADSLVPLNNGWTYMWQGANAALYPKDRPTLRGAVSEKIGPANVIYVPGSGFDRVIDTSKVTEAAAQADAIILALGEDSYAETPGNIDDLTLSAPQLQLAQAAVATGKPVILVLVEGRPRIISSIAGRIPAILMAYNPSNEGGQAIADVLFGDCNPSGKLPFTYPRHTNALINYDHKRYETEEQPFSQEGSKPQFDFGTGLSYTTFAYSNLAATPAKVSSGQNIKVSVAVKNTGQREGKEVVELYLSDLAASITPPGRRLVRFGKIDLKPDESRTLSFTITPEDLSFIGADLKPTIEPGDFEVSVGGLHASFTLAPAQAGSKRV